MLWLILVVVTLDLLLSSLMFMRLVRRTEKHEAMLSQQIIAQMGAYAREARDAALAARTASDLAAEKVGALNLTLLGEEKRGRQPSGSWR